MTNISTAVVMCGGDSSRFGYVCKSLVMYKGRFIITYVFEALKEIGVINPILKANPSNREFIEFLARKYFESYEVVVNPPKPMRYALRELKPHLDSDFYLVVGNQPMPASHLDSMRMLK